jgi:hypothetical protein
MASVTGLDSVLIASQARSTFKRGKAEHLPQWVFDRQAAGQGWQHTHVPGTGTCWDCRCCS